MKGPEGTAKRVGKQTLSELRLLNIEYFIPVHDIAIVQCPMPAAGHDIQLNDITNPIMSCISTSRVINMAVRCRYDRGITGKCHES